jgi:Uma2 family endonuclease
MSGESQKIYSLEEYFELEHQSDAYHVYWNGEVTLIPEAHPNHTRIARNIIETLSSQLENDACEVYDNDQRVKVHVSSPYLYPDLCIPCPSPEFETIGGLLVLVNPILIVEILSQTNTRDDKRLTFTQYQTIPSLRDYLLVDSRKVEVAHYRKQADGIYLPVLVTSLNSSIRIASLDCYLKLNKIYSRIDFSLE